MSSQDEPIEAALEPLGGLWPTPPGPRRSALFPALEAAFASLRGLRLSRAASAGLDDRLLRDVGLVRLRNSSGRIVLAPCGEPGSGL